jgi:hypothetical protein
VVRDRGAKKMQRNRRRRQTRHRGVRRGYLLQLHQSTQIRKVIT